MHATSFVKPIAAGRCLLVSRISEEAVRLSHHGLPRENFSSDGITRTLEPLTLAVVHHMAGLGQRRIGQSGSPPLSDNARYGVPLA